MNHQTWEVLTYGFTLNWWKKSIGIIGPENPTRFGSQIFIPLEHSFRNIFFVFAKKQESREIIADDTGQIPTDALFHSKDCSLHSKTFVGTSLAGITGRTAFSLNSLLLMDLGELLVGAQCAHSCQPHTAFIMLGFLLENRRPLKSRFGQVTQVMRKLGK